MVNIAICDDDRLSLQNTAEMLNAWANINNHRINVSTYENGDDLINSMAKHSNDIIILDIMMPLFNGMEIAKELRQTGNFSQIVFLTSSAEYAVESYDVKASGYLLKPVNEEKLFKVLDDCAKRIIQSEKSILIKTPEGYRNIELKKIEFIEAQNKSVAIHLNDSIIVEGTETFSNFCKQLTEEKGFFKCHRSYLVGFANVDRFNNNEIVTCCEDTIPIARGVGKIFKESYFKYMFKKEEGEA